jgi:kinesin family protein 18/19
VWGAGTVMIANIAPNVLSFEETMNTLKYADRAKAIKTNVSRNVVVVNFKMTGVLPTFSCLPHD